MWIDVGGDGWQGIERILMWLKYAREVEVGYSPLYIEIGVVCMGGSGTSM
jgi:hypothetical protein